MSPLDSQRLLSRFDVATGTVEGAATSARHLGDLRGCFADRAAFDRALAAGNPMVYSVSSVEPAGGGGDLHVGLGLLMPGRIGEEYFMTKGHFHAWREAAEVYVGLGGEGAMLLEDEASGESRLVPLGPNSFVYVPGRTAHRTVNTGLQPLTYLGIYPAKAGHDYGAIATRNFRKRVIRQDGRPAMVDRR